MISYQFYISFIDQFSIGNWFLVWNRNRNSSNNRNLFDIRCRNWNCSSNGNFFKNRILNMMNIILLIILLDNRLCNKLLSGNLYCFASSHIVHLNSLDYRFDHNLLIWQSIDLNFDIFSLDNGLNKRLTVNFSSRSLYSLNSILRSHYRQSCDWI